jgi:hypothetical protein
MKITFEILGILLLVLAATAAVNYFIQRKREQTAQRDGVVVYATLVSVEPVRGLAKVNMRKITMRVQEPDSSPREVSIRTRVEPNQKIVAGAVLPMVIDPKDPRRVYPATAESAKRAVLTGSRQERRIMQSQLRTPSPGRARQRPPSGYQPPVSKLR